MKDIETIKVIQTQMAVDQLLLFFESLLTRYEWEASKKVELRQQIEEVRLKQRDPNLYLGIIGEFSSGKSTFINTLMRDDFLKMDNLQGTTTALTIFQYGDPID